MLDKKVLNLVKEKIKLQDEIQNDFENLKSKGLSILDVSKKFDKLTKIQDEALKILNDNQIYVNYIILCRLLKDEEYEKAEKIKNKIINS